MSYASGIGSFGFGCQAAKGTAATSSLQFIPASRVGMVPTQIVNMTPPEIGGGLVLKEAYKAGVYVTGDAMFTVRPDDIGWLLYALCGAVNTTADTPEAGMHTHVFKMATDQSSLPWLTVLKNVSDVLTEQYLDCRVAGATFQITAGGAMTVSFRFVGMTPSIISNPTETFDATPILIGCEGVAQIDLGSGLEDVKATGVTVELNNGLTEDEWIIGSRYLDDITCLARRLSVTWNTKLVSDALYKKVYYGGSTTFSAEVFSGDIQVAAKSGANAPSLANPYSLTIDIGEMAWQAMPIPLDGNSLVVMTLSGQMVVPSAGDEYSITLVNETADYTWPT